MNRYVNSLFNLEKLTNEINALEIRNIDKKIRIIEKWSNNKHLKKLNEEQLKGEFFRDIFVDVLGYKTVISGEKEWSFSVEQKTEVDGSKPDAIIGLYSRNNSINRTFGVIEVKGFNVDLDEKQKRFRKNYGTPVEQAFSYASKYDGCKWVIVSNFQEIRLYKVGRSQNYYEVFHLDSIQEKYELKKFYLLLSRKSLISREEKSYTEKLSEKINEIEKDISKKFYKQYKEIRLKLINTIKYNNKHLNMNECIRCSQKFLDRVIFICFCEGMNLLKPYELKNAIKRGKSSYNGIWNEIQGLFKALDKGRQDLKINRFNGELFKFDEVLDNCKISDEFFESLNEIFEYKFSYEINVEILGYIFEQSISDIEELKKSLNEKGNYEYVGRRNKEGIYYTPEKITKFIVEMTLGKYLDERFKEVCKKYNFSDAPLLRDNNGGNLNVRQSKELIIYEEYREILKKIKVLDASCGSGAFLVQVHDFLMNEYKRVERKISVLRKDFSISIFQLNEEILSENIYGVDINEESVEITKLSLWLKTVQKDKPLMSLNNCIKCGNSIIHDNKFTSKAFDWEKEFPEVMKGGGFDVIVGNPPYLKWHLIEPRKPFENGEYLGFKYHCRIKHKDSQPNLYIFFIILCFKLLKENGFLGLITSQEWLNYKKLDSIKKVLLERGSINNIIFDSRYSLFIDFDGKNIGTNSSIMIYEKGIFKQSTSINIPFNEEDKFLTSRICSNNPYKIYKSGKWNKHGITFEKEGILCKINNKSAISLDNKKYFRVFAGFQPPTEKIELYELSETEYSLVPTNERNIIYRAIKNAKSIDKYKINDEGRYWIIANDIPNETAFKNQYPYLFNLLKNRIVQKEDPYWYKFPNTRNLKEFKTLDKKILVPRTRRYNAFALDEYKYVFKGTNSCIYVKREFDIKYVLGILNSVLLNFWYQFNGQDYHGLTRKYEPKSVQIFKIPIVSKNIQSNISYKVDKIIENSRELSKLIDEFRNWLKLKYNINIDDTFYNFDSSEFIKKYFKQEIIKISPKQLAIINKIFNKYSEQCRDIKKNLDLLIEQINQIVYEIYNINEEEKKMINEHIK